MLCMPSFCLIYIPHFFRHVISPEHAFSIRFLSTCSYYNTITTAMWFSETRRDAKYGICHYLILVNMLILHHYCNNVVAFRSVFRYGSALSCVGAVLWRDTLRIICFVVHFTQTRSKRSRMNPRRSQENCGPRSRRWNSVGRAAADLRVGAHLQWCRFGCIRVYRVVC